jgi:hypothetical protein
MCDLKLQWDGYISVARLRLLKIENPSAFVTVNCKVCKSAIALYCLWSRVVNAWGALNPIIQSGIRLISHAQNPLKRDSIMPRFLELHEMKTRYRSSTGPLVKFIQTSSSSKQLTRFWWNLSTGAAPWQIFIQNLIWGYIWSSHGCSHEEFYLPRILLPVSCWFFTLFVSLP